MILSINFAILTFFRSRTVIAESRIKNTPKERNFYSKYSHSILIYCLFYVLYSEMRHSCLPESPMCLFQ